MLIQLKSVEFAVIQHAAEGGGVRSGGNAGKGFFSEKSGQTFIRNNGIDQRTAGSETALDGKIDILRLAQKRVDPLKTWNAHNCICSFWVLWYNFAPGNQCLSGDSIYQLTPDKIFLIPPNVHYSGWLGAEVPHFYIWFQAGPPFEHPERKVIEIPAAPFLKRIKSTLISGPRQKFLLFTLVSEILSEIPEQVFDKKDFSNRSKIIEKALQLINLRDGCISNKELAAELHLSVTRISHLFKSEVGISPQRYCSRIKMHTAELLLRAGHSIDEVAVSCGFSDRYHFSKEFKRWSKVSPGKWRKQFWENKNSPEEFPLSSVQMQTEADISVSGNRHTAEPAFCSMPEDENA